MRLVWGDVVTDLGSKPGVQRLEVRLDRDEVIRRALCYAALCGSCAVGDRVLINTTAVDLGLGTGGSDLIVARAPRHADGGGVALETASGGHIMKLRYSPLQLDVLSVEERAHPAHETMSEARDLDGMPVVCCGLHSQVAPAAAAVKATRPQARLAYVMTDEAALALPMSESVHACREANLVDVTLTCGQSFGGEIEAVNLHSALLAARHVAGVDVAIVAIGPGVAGTGTPFGHGGIAQGLAVNAAAALGGRPVAALRVSFADARERHRGVSHHTLTALGRVALAPCEVAVPALPEEQAAAVDDALERAGIWGRHEGVAAGERDLPDTRGVRLSTMGRGPADDPAFFLAAAAAGTVAARPRADGTG